MKENTKSAAEIAHQKLQEKLRKMVEELPLDDDEHGCGSGCNHHHHHGQRD